FGLGGNGVRLVERLGGRLHPDVARPFERLEERDVLAVGRDLRARDLRVAEEEVAIDDRWKTACGGSRRRLGPCEPRRGGRDKDGDAENQRTNTVGHELLLGMVDPITEFDRLTMDLE